MMTMLDPMLLAGGLLNAAILPQPLYAHKTTCKSHPPLQPTKRNNNDGDDRLDKANIYRMFVSKSHQMWRVLVSRPSSPPLIHKYSSSGTLG
jgi:hypothetical protein